jgi:hypothetical protein
MTYGEKIVREKEKMQMKNGVFVICGRLPPRMSFDKAVKILRRKTRPLLAQQNRTKPSL